MWQFSTGDHTRYVFRYHFVKGQDDHIFINIFNYFSSIRKTWPDAWDKTGLGNVLPRTNGYLAFMRFIKPAILNYSTEPCIVPQQHFEKLFEVVEKHLHDNDFNTSNFPPGTSGETRLFHELVRTSGINSDQASLL